MTEKLGMLEAARLTISIAAPAARMVLGTSPVEQPGREHVSIDVALIETETLLERSKPRGDEPPGPAHEEDVYGENGERSMTKRRSGLPFTARPLMICTACDSGPAEAVATRLTRLLSDSLAALADKKPDGTGPNPQQRPTRRGRSAKPVNSFAD